MAEGDDNDQKTEAPTGKRLEEAREHGQIPVSRETTTWVSLVGIVISIAWIMPPMMVDMANYLKTFIESAHNFPLDDKNIQSLLFNVMGSVGMIAALVFIVPVSLSVIANMAQTGFLFALDLLSPDLTRLLPSRGLAKLFSMNSVVELAKSAGKLIFLGGIAYTVLKPVALNAPTLTGMALVDILLFLQHNAIHLMIMLILGFTIIAAGDLFYTRYQYIKNLRMTKVEVKDEFKQMEGDPQIKSRLRAMRVERARKRMIAQVPKADVIITNPSHYSVALKYEGGKMTAPVVIAKGINLIALRIREIAEEHRIPQVSNPPLARALHDTVEVDHPIPTQHYRAVAEIISYVYKLRKRRF